MPLAEEHHSRSATSAVTQAFQELLSNVRFADILDVAVMTVLLYVLLAWCRERASRPLLMGLVLIALIYLGARWLEMYLTTMMFQVGITVVLFALVVVFQQDIRRAVERMAASRWLQPAGSSPQISSVLDTLVDAASALANQKTGALIVLKGREPLEHHVRSGVDVNGAVSFPLLCSIFNPKSPGHDGAVIVDRGRIESLGAHLPLSQRPPTTISSGTRHAAALGLAECCDALVIVVSEERGVICVAENGEIREFQASELRPQITRFYEDRNANQGLSSGWQSFWRNSGLKLLALAIACGLWFMFAYRVDSLQRTIVVNIEYRNLPNNLTLGNSFPNNAELVLSGSERAFDLLDTRSLEISFNLEGVEAGSTYYLPTRDNLSDLPEDLSISQIDPEQVEIDVRTKAPNDQPE